MEITGNAAWLGEPHLRGIQLYVEQVNQSGGINGRRIELITYDNESNVEKSVANAKKLVQRDKVVATLGPGTNAMIRAAVPVMQEANITSYAHSASFDPNIPDSYWFTSFASVQDNIATFFDWFKSKGFTRMGQICSTDSAGQTWQESSIKIAESYPGVQLSSERFNVNDLDITPQLAKLRAANPQGLMVGSTGKSSGVAIKNLMQMGFKIPIFTGAGNVSQSFLDMIAENEPEIMLLPGSKFVIYQDLPASDPLKPLMKKFADDFKKRFNKEADNYGAVAYDAARILFEAIKAVNPAGPGDSGKLRAYIERMKNYPGVYGAYYNFSPQDHRGLSRAAIVLIQTKGKKFLLYEK
jgi:branched-chain amino acid transport system substrate-binding protein